MRHNRTDASQNPSIITRLAGPGTQGSHDRSPRSRPPLAHRTRELANMLDKALDHRAQGSVLQRDESIRRRSIRQIDWQYLDGMSVAVQAQRHGRDVRAGGKQVHAKWRGHNDPALALGIGKPRRLEGLHQARVVPGIGRRRAIIDRLNNEINAGLADPTIKARLTDLAYRIFSSSPADFGRFIAAETEKWGNVIRAANIKA